MAFIDKYGFGLQVGLVAFLVVFGLLGTGIGCSLYSLACGGLLMAFKGKTMGLGYAACFRVALATSSTVLLLKALLHLMGAGTGFFLGLIPYLLSLEIPS